MFLPLNYYLLQIYKIILKRFHYVQFFSQKVTYPLIGRNFSATMSLNLNIKYFLR